MFLVPTTVLALVYTFPICFLPRVISDDSSACLDKSVLLQSGVQTHFLDSDDLSQVKQFHADRFEKIENNPMFLDSVQIGRAIMQARVNYDKTQENSIGWGSWRRALPSVLSAVKALQLPLHTIPGDVYQFGVYKGDSMKIIQKAFHEARLLGFDSFMGLPEEADGHRIDANWTRGGWDSGDVRAELTSQLGGREMVRFVKGFFNESLTSSLPQQLSLKPAQYIDVDVDLYSSTLEALDFMFGHKLVHVGTLIGYDDWWPLPCGNRTYCGAPPDCAEGLAHAEIAAKYGVKFACISGSCDANKAKIYKGNGVVFLVTALGSESLYDHGFHLTDQEITDFCR
mmetsp:Transcript_68698/g.108996  ORF Transcript_68698/g.108996 Transcript_68698/m.108996 type:complete len:341 (+) Transcript_68698:34-1056(+)